jgi:SAM-dependent methyltransferase
MTNGEQSRHAATSPTNSEAVRCDEGLGDNGQEPTVDRTSDAARSGVGGVLPPVLDACCGSRMFWFDKRDQRALFVDKRRETLTDNTGKRPAEICVDPDVLADFGALPFGDASFSLVVFDPPHTFCGPNGRTIKKYGTLPLGWRNMIARGFSECFRVLCPGGTLVFKWNEHRVKLSTVLSLTPEQPLFGQRVGNTLTHWLVFLKGGGGAELGANYETCGTKSGAGSPNARIRDEAPRQ